MAFLVKNLDRVEVMVEVTEGTPVDAAANSDMIEPVSDSVTLDIEKAEIERKLLGGTVESDASRVGLPTISGALTTELRSHSTAGAAPVDNDRLLQSLLGGKSAVAAATTTTGNTTTVLTFSSHSFTAGMVALIKITGAYECRPIASVTATTITLAFAVSAGSIADGTEVEAVCVYYPDSTLEKSLTVTHRPANDLKHQAAGIRATSGSISGWSTGETPSMEFALSGLSIAKTVGAGSYSPAANTALPPVILNSCAYINGTLVDYNEFSLAIEKEVADAPSACQASGIVSKRTTGIKISGKIDPYTSDVSVARFGLYDDNTDISLLVFAYNPTSTAGEYGEVVAIWIPQAKITKLPLKDVNGVYADDLEFKTHKTSAGNDSLFLNFI